MKSIATTTFAIAALALSACSSAPNQDATEFLKEIGADSEKHEGEAIERSPESLAKTYQRFSTRAKAGDRSARKAIDQQAGALDAWRNGIYWHKDFDQALAAAEEADKPLLSLRILGHWDEEFC